MSRERERKTVCVCDEIEHNAMKKQGNLMKLVDGEATATFIPIATNVNVECLHDSVLEISVCHLIQKRFVRARSQTHVHTHATKVIQFNSFLPC